jgi:hypothetical protein
MALNLERILQLSETYENDPDCPPMSAEQAQQLARIMAPVGIRNRP